MIRMLNSENTGCAYQQISGLSDDPNQTIRAECPNTKKDAIIFAIHNNGE